MAGERLDRSALIAAALTVFTLSFIIHMPGPYGNPSNYSDIVFLYERDFIAGVRVPYLEFRFEYPVIVGLLFYSSAVVPELLGLTGRPAILLYYTLMSIPILVSYIALILGLLELSKYLHSPMWRIMVFSVFAPSFIYFLVYNWDVIAICLAVWSLVKWSRGDKVRAYVLAGLSAAVKLIPGLVALAYALEEDRLVDRVKALVIPALAFLAPNIPFIVLNPGLWLETWTYHASWYIEDSWLIMFFDFADQRSHIVSALVFSALMLLVAFTTDRACGEGIRRVVENSWLLIACFVFSNYVYTPQMNILVDPLLALVPVTTIPLFYVFDMLNTMIILFWFSQDKLTSLLLGYSVPTLHRASPVMWFATARCIMLLYFILRLLRARLRSYVS